MRRPRVNALIDTYNHEGLIAEAIESVLAQDFAPSEMEILIVHDGSTDVTPGLPRGMRTASGTSARRTAGSPPR